MKQLFTFILVTLMAVTHAQTLTWEQTGIKVPAGNADAVVALVDGFYSSIDFPEGVSLELSAVSFSGENQKATHHLQYSGTSEGLAAMRNLEGVPNMICIQPSWLLYVKSFQHNQVRD